MEFPGQKRRHIIQVDLIGNRQQSELALELSIRWRSRIDFELDFDQFGANDCPCQILVSIAQQNALSCVSLYKCGLYVRIICLYLCLSLKVEPICT